MDDVSRSHQKRPTNVHTKLIRFLVKTILKTFVGRDASINCSRRVWGDTKTVRLKSEKILPQVCLNFKASCGIALGTLTLTFVFFAATAQFRFLGPLYLRIHRVRDSTRREIDVFL